MPANDVVLYAQWAENVEPINPVTPINPGEPKNNISPKTGDATDLLGFSILLLGSLSLIGRLVNKKTKKKSRRKLMIGV